MRPRVGHPESSAVLRHSAPTVSVVVPLYNVGAMVADCLRSLRAQSLTDWEAIVVDDGSTDESPEIVERVAREDARVRLIRKPNGGVSSARNLGIGHARGRYVHLFDADDVLEAGALERLVYTAEASGTAGAFGAYLVCDARCDPLWVYRDAKDRVGLDDLLDRTFMLPASHLVRREAYAGVRFDESIVGYEDVEGWSQLAAHGVTWAVTASPVARYRIRPGSASKAAGPMLRDASVVYPRMFDLARERGGDPRLLSLRERAMMRRLALSHACRGAVLDPSKASEFASLFDGDDGTPLSVRELMTIGFFSVLYGLGEWPFYDAKTPPRWAAGLVALWEAWAEAGVLDHQVAASARRSLARPVHTRPTLGELMGVAA